MSAGITTHEQQLNALWIRTVSSLSVLSVVLTPSMPAGKIITKLQCLEVPSGQEMLLIFVI